MDRRTVLAFVLIFVILMGSQMLMEKFYGQPDAIPVAGDAVEQAGPAATPPAGAGPSAVQAETGTPPAGADPAAPLAAAGDLATAAEALRLVDEGAPREITVTTPLYRVEVSTVGGRITSWEGLDYDHWEGGPVQLVPADKPPFGLDAVLFGGTQLDLGAAVFRAAEAELTVTGGIRSLALFVSLAGGMEVRKTYTFHADSYHIDVDYALVAVDGGPTRRALELLGRPEDFRFGWNQGINPTERNQKMEESAMRAVARVGDEYVYKKLMDLRKGEAKVQEQRRGSVRFAGLQDRYFTIVGIVPWEQGEAVEGTIRLGGDQGLNAQSWSIDVPARRGTGGDVAVASFDLYIGPQEAELLSVYDHGLEESMELGWKLFRPLAEIVLVGLKWMHRYIPNYGVIIIIFSVLTKLAFYPLTRKSTESMKKMQELQPKLKALQEKHKDNREKLNEATMKLYKEEKVNPMAGCLPLLVQSPVFIALYQALNHTIALRGQPFVLWMTDLSQPDALTQLPFALPFLGSDLNVLPILMAVAMYFQTKMTPTGGMGGQMAVMNTMMPLIMVFIFYNMPSGLVLYWLVNTIMQAYQSWQIHRTAPSQGVQTA
ncbi:MAG: membrane protein insertase YidC [Candidatus Krumholzibacteriia bacterium]